MVHLNRRPVRAYLQTLCVILIQILKFTNIQSWFFNRKILFMIIEYSCFRYCIFTEWRRHIGHSNRQRASSGAKTKEGSFRSVKVTFSSVISVRYRIINESAIQWTNQTITAFIWFFFWYSFSRIAGGIPEFRTRHRYRSYRAYSFEIVWSPFKTEIAVPHSKRQ